MKVLVTGGSGFIGSNVVDVLLENRDQVLNYDLKAPRVDHHREYWFQGDILDPELLYRCIEGFAPEAVIHLAAKADINADDWSDYASIHQGTKILRDVIDRYGKLDTLVNISTQLVIGPERPPRSAARLSAIHDVWGRQRRVRREPAFAVAISNPLAHRAPREYLGTLPSLFRRCDLQIHTSASLSAS